MRAAVVLAGVGAMWGCSVSIPAPAPRPGEPARREPTAAPPPAEPPRARAPRAREDPPVAAPSVGVRGSGREIRVVGLGPGWIEVEAEGAGAEAYLAVYELAAGVMEEPGRAVRVARADGGVVSLEGGGEGGAFPGPASIVLEGTGRVRVRMVVPVRSRGGLEAGEYRVRVTAGGLRLPAGAEATLRVGR